MSVSRDRMERPVDYAAIFANRRRCGVLLDEPASHLSAFELTGQRLPSGSRMNPPRPGSLVGAVRGNYSSWRRGSGNGSGQSLFRLSQGRENVTRHGRGGGGASQSLLPSWYPRTPLRDITHIMRAIERKRRAGVRVDDGLETESPTQRQVLETPVASASEGSYVMVTPAPAVGFKRSCPPSTAKVHKMLLDITKDTSEEEKEEARFITPEKKLLNSIGMVEKIVMAEIQKLKSTPLAKREERENRVKTLMSMR